MFPVYTVHIGTEQRKKHRNVHHLCSSKYGIQDMFYRLLLCKLLHHQVLSFFISFYLFVLVVVVLMASLESSVKLTLMNVYLAPVLTMQNV